MRLIVSVPVLSVQMTVAEPSVSTAERRLTRAPLRASTRTPVAKASVMVGRRPSGTLATSRPIPNTTAWVGVNPAKIPSGTNVTPTTTATSKMSQATRSPGARAGCPRGEHAR